MLLSLTLFAVSVLPGAEVPIAIIPVLLGPRHELGLSMINDQISAAASMRPRLKIVMSEDLDRVRGCGADEVCIANELRASNMTIGLLVVINTVLDPPVVSLRVVDAAQQKVIDRESGDDLRLGAERLFDRLGHPRLSRISVTTEPSDAEVELGLMKERSPAIFWLAPGSYPIVARYEDRRAESIVHVDKAGADIDVALALRAVEAPESIFATPWFWGGAAVVTAAIVVTSVLILAPRNFDVCVGGADAC